MRITGNRGSILIASYLVIAAFLVYSNALTMRTLTQRVTLQRSIEQYQALDLAQGTLEQLYGALSENLINGVYQQIYQGDAIKALEWLYSQASDFPAAPYLDAGRKTKPGCVYNFSTL